jgi:long-chain acyl-CoA synthetase
MDIDKYKEVIDQPERWLTELQRSWLLPRSRLAAASYAGLYFVNWILIRLLFRVSVEGSEHLPVSGPFVVTPNHASPLDPPVLAAAISLTVLQNTFWAGKQSTVLRNGLRRCMSWFTRVIPIHEDRTAVAAAITSLEHGHNLIWFPEGERSLNGQLHHFRSGIAILLSRCDVPVLPVLIQGAYDAFPTRKSWPRLWTRIIVRIGPPQSAQQLGLTSFSPEAIQRAAATLQQRVAELESR